MLCLKVKHGNFSLILINLMEFLLIKWKKYEACILLMISFHVKIIFIIILNLINNNCCKSWICVNSKTIQICGATVVEGMLSNIGM